MEVLFVISLIALGFGIFSYLSFSSKAIGENTSIYKKIAGIISLISTFGILFVMKSFGSKKTIKSSYDLDREDFKSDIEEKETEVDELKKELSENKEEVSGFFENPDDAREYIRSKIRKKG